MSDTTDARRAPRLTVADRVIAKIVAHEAAQVPGVARLHPYRTQAAVELLRSVTTAAAARVTGVRAGGRHGADAAAVSIERDDHRTVTTVTVRIVSTIQPPVLHTVSTLQQRLSDRLRALIGTDPLIVVDVLDVEGA